MEKTITTENDSAQGRTANSQKVKLALLTLAGMTCLSSCLSTPPTSGYGPEVGPLPPSDLTTPITTTEGFQTLFNQSALKTHANTEGCPPLIQLEYNSELFESSAVTHLSCPENRQEEERPYMEYGPLLGESTQLQKFVAVHEMAHYCIKDNSYLSPTVTFKASADEQATLYAFCGFNINAHSSKYYYDLWMVEEGFAAFYAFKSEGDPGSYSPIGRAMIDYFDTLLIARSGWEGTDKTEALIRSFEQHKESDLIGFLLACAGRADLNKGDQNVISRVMTALLDSHNTFTARTNELYSQTYDERVSAAGGAKAAANQLLQDISAIHIESSGQEVISSTAPITFSAPNP